MGRKSTANSFLNKKLGGVKLKQILSVDNGRLFVICECLNCKKEFKAKFHNIYKGQYKSCGCLKHASGKKNPKWKGLGEISKSLFFSLQRGAEVRNIKFNISLNDIWDLFLKQNGKCVFSGANLTFPKNRKDTSYTASLDRIDSSKGYELDNIQWIERNINFMKQSMNNEEFLYYIKKIYQYKYE